MTLIFATCEAQPLLTADDAVLAAALGPLDVEVTAVPWTEIDPFAAIDAPPIMLRSTWDYHRVPTMFRVWLDGLRESGRAVWNGPDIAAGNIDKIYLRQLAERGVRIPQTRWLERPDVASVRETMAVEGWARAVLKPRIAATAYGTFLVDHNTELDLNDLAPGRASGALLQEFIPEIADEGEASLVYCEGVFSHAVVKHARRGDFRVQKDFGGVVEQLTPSREMLRFADHVISVAAAGSLYARVDLVMTGRGPTLMELELIEPELYFLSHPEAAARFALAVASKLTA